MRRRSRSEYTSNLLFVLMKVGGILLMLFAAPFALVSILIGLTVALVRFLVTLPILMFVCGLSLVIGADAVRPMRFKASSWRWAPKN